MDNNEILNQITNPLEKMVFKSMREDMETGKALLNPEQLGRFLRAATIDNVILAQADFSLLKSFKKILNTVGINGRVLQSGYKTDGATNDEVSAAELDFGGNELDVKKLKAMCQIEDDEKEDNIEKEAFESTLLTMMGERFGEDLEFWALFSDTDISRSDNELLSTADGWLKLCPNVVESTGISGGGEDFDVEANTVESMFDAMLLKMNPRFRQKRQDLRFFVPFEVEDAYRNLLKSRGTNLGDSTQTAFNGLAYKGIPVVHCPTLDDEVGRCIDDTATAMLTNPKNLAYGVYKNVSIEPYRITPKELTQYWYRMRADINYYHNDGTVIGKISTKEAADLPLESKL